MTMGLPSIQQLQLFAAVAEHGGFGAAAAALDCTQSGISYAVGRLERELGVRLLVRSRSGCTLTPPGERVLVRVRELLALAGSLGEAARGQGPAGQVRIACFRSVATHLLPHVVEALSARHPALFVDIDDSHEERDSVAQAVRDGRCAIGIAQLPVGAGLEWQPFMGDSYALVVPAALRAEAGKGWAPLAALPFIGLDCSGARAVLERCRAAGFSARPTRTLSSDSAICAMVARGLGYSILPRLAVFPEPDGVAVLDLPVVARRDFVLATRAHATRDPAVQAVLRALRSRQVLAASAALRAGVVRWPQARAHL